ncbi:MAG: hypothetical protein WDA06_00120 [Phenylobacterium sp.]
MSFMISDFLIVKKILELGCKTFNLPFSDVSINFGNNGNKQINSKELNIPVSEKTTKIYYDICAAYLNNFHRINGSDVFSDAKSKTIVLIQIFRFLSKLCVNDPFFKFDEKIVVGRLYQRSFVWLFFKNIICPIYTLDLKNIKLIYHKSQFMDICDVIDNEQLEELNKDEEPFIAVNLGINYGPCLDACLIIAILQYFKLNPHDVIMNIMQSEVSDIFFDLIKLEFNESQGKDFFGYLLTLSGVENIFNEMTDRANMKVAQITGDLESNWWFSGLLEKMLEPARGSDWSTYMELEPFVDEVRQKIDIAREEKGRDGFTFEAMLRLKSGETGPEDWKVIEKMLSSDRIW